MTRPHANDIVSSVSCQVLDSEDEDWMAAETRSTDTLTECSAECIALASFAELVFEPETFGEITRDSGVLLKLLRPRELTSSTP